jgi:hypothetical protein
MNKIRMKICSKICNKVALMKTKIANFKAKINKNFNHSLLLEKKNNNKMIFQTKQHHFWIIINSTENTNLETKK